MSDEFYGFDDPDFDDEQECRQADRENRPENMEHGGQGKLATREVQGIWHHFAYLIIRKNAISVSVG